METDETKKEEKDPLEEEQVANEAMIRRFLVRLKKLQVNESLDRLEAQGRSQTSLLVPGISQRQIELTRSWVTHLIMSNLEIAVDWAEKQKDKADEPAPEQQTVADAPKDDKPAEDGPVPEM